MHAQVGREHSLLADLLRMSGSLPPALRLQGVQDGRFAAVLFDYRYFKDRQAVEAKIEASPELTQLDEAVREVCVSQAPACMGLHHLRGVEACGV